VEKERAGDTERKGEACQRREASHKCQFGQFKPNFRGDAPSEYSAFLLKNMMMERQGGFAEKRKRNGQGKFNSSP
jgi:hypothetical protein